MSKWQEPILAITCIDTAKYSATFVAGQRRYIYTEELHGTTRNFAFHHKTPPLPFRRWMSQVSKVLSRAIRYVLRTQLLGYDRCAYPWAATYRPSFYLHGSSLNVSRFVWPQWPGMSIVNCRECDVDHLEAFPGSSCFPCFFLLEQLRLNDMSVPGACRN